jgi:hypothetical protein
MNINSILEMYSLYEEMIMFWMFIGMYKEIKKVFVEGVQMMAIREEFIVKKIIPNLKKILENKTKG